MNTITFDTLKYANTLKAAGVAPQQAEAQASALSEVLEVNMRELATKGDLALLRKDLDSDMTSLRKDLDRTRQELKADILQLEQRMTIKLGGMMVIAIGVAATLVKLL
jgi:hypothetical protein